MIYVISERKSLRKSKKNKNTFANLRKSQSQLISASVFFYKILVFSSILTSHRSCWYTLYMYIDKVWGTKLAKNYPQGKGKRLNGAKQLVYYTYIINLELIYVYYIKEIVLVFYFFYFIFCAIYYINYWTFNFSYFVFS